ncbi:uncharacterized protein BX663DRAFT_550583 [Cokeromyces recurvatus]|uniref:uncharacterized protein n=1 Tax=Cokeromyces recurvatus TaxID=90255 RepID=UPI0022200FDA|nr:uncharacterized protein BX663DRAFT_550583 [Cokeromyces recurvatus]KAI7904185.1 hypothetical protein BX663DRAFT_550583 [Cokeromyces recurvatus]
MNELPLSLTCLDWLNTDQLWTLWKFSNKSVNQALLTKRQFQDKFRVENFTWRLWYHCHQQKLSINNNSATADTSTTTTTTTNNNNNNTIIQRPVSKFYLDDEDEEEEYEDDNNCSVFSSEEEEEEEEELLFEKKLNQSYSNTSSLLTQMLNPKQEEIITEYNTTALKRCQAKYQCLNEWFTTEIIQQ